MKRLFCRGASHPDRLSWDAVLFFALYTIMPSYCALELHTALPLLTVSRIVLVLMGVMLVVRRRTDLFCLRKPDWRGMNLLLTGNRFLRWGLLLFFAALMASHIALLGSHKTDALKGILLLVSEYYMLTWLLTLVLDTRAKLLTGMKVLICASAVTAVIALTGVLLDFNPFHLLNTVSQDMLMEDYIRLGLLRAAAGFGHPVYYGAFCVIMCPLCMYFTEHGKNRRERLLGAGCLILNINALVFANARGSMMAFCCLLGLMFLIRLLSKKLKRFFAVYLPVGGAALALMILISSLSPMGAGFLVAIVHSVLVAFFPEGDFSFLEQFFHLPPGVTFGDNADGTFSRLVQLTGILWTLMQKPLFGFGHNAQLRGEIAYQFYEGQWWNTHTFDMGIVSMIGQYGLAGLAGYTALYGSVCKTAFLGRYRRDSLMHFLGLSFVTFLLCLLAISSLDRLSWLVLAFIVCLTNIIEKEQSSQ